MQATTNENKPVLVVDGPSILHRAYHAYEPTDMRDKDNNPLWAVHGFFALLGGICDKVQPSKLIVGFDDDTVSERQKQYPLYKSQRGERPAAVKQQMDKVQIMLREMQIPVLLLKGWEADDVLASVAKSCEKDQLRCVIATSDRDSFQLISEQVTVMRLVSGLKNAQMITPAALQERYGVTPKQYLEYAALRGDTSDNLPGVPGFGEKTAAKLLQATKTVAQAYKDVASTESVIGKSTTLKLVENKATFERNYQIMSPFVAPLDVKPMTLPDSAKVQEVLEAAGLTQDARRVPSLIGKSAPVQQQTQAATSQKPNVQHLRPGSVWDGMWHVTGKIPGTNINWTKVL